MNWESWMLWGFVSTLLMTTMEFGGQALSFTRVDFPYMLGTIFTPDRERAKVYGFFVHLFNGWAFSLLYVLAFESWHQVSWWRGALIGVVHAAFVLLVVMSIMPGIHPRMASEQNGPTANRQLEPPGILGLNYGIRTPVSMLLSHVVFGIVLGSFYQLGIHGHP
ncbi:MAG TPA: hypothetical protein VN577_22795 [Terriglobales bacterium]|nr:hypothetical protein [Terriglobales bacterium]